MRYLTTLLSWRFFLFVSFYFLSNASSAQSGPCDGSVQIPDTVRTQVNCSATVSLTGLEPSSIVWKDLNSSSGAYLRYLDCVEGCENVTFSLDSTAERFIRYEVCGNISSGLCPQNYSICDTIVLEVIPTPRTTARVDICEGFTYEWQDRLFTEEGFYTDTLVSSRGCDSLVSLDLKVNPSRRGTLSATICPGEYFELGGERFDQSGAYEVTLTDSINCDSIVTLNLEVLPGPAPRIEGPPVLCSGATATLQVPEAGSFTAFRWSNGGAASSIDVTEPGTYSVTVSAANGCATPVSYTLEGAPAVDASIAGRSTINCINQIASLRSEFFPDPAAAGVKLEWRNRDGRLLSEAPTFETTQPGWYYLKVTDNSGFCSDVDSVWVRESEGLPKFILSSSGVLDCRTDEVMLSVELESNLSNQRIRWTGPGVISGSPDLQVTEAGWYIMEVTNLDIGCTVRDSIQVTSSRRAPRIRLADKVTLRCNASEVTLRARVSGGNVRYSWRTPDGQLEGNLSADRVKATTSGWYFVDVTNRGNGCTATDSVRVVNPPPIRTVDLEVKASCSNDPEGRIRIREVKGGKRPYRFSLDTGQKPNRRVFSNLDPGTYQVQLVDGFGCRWDSTVTIQAIEIDSSMEMAEICEGMLYSWNGKDYGEAGLYTDTLTASTGCDSIAVLDLRVNSTVHQVSREAAICPGDTYNFQGQTFDRPGTYRIPVPGATGCDSVIALTLSFLPVDTPEIVGPAVLCEGDSAELSLSGSFSSYEWSDGSTTDAIVVRREGNYSVTVTDDQGCRTQASYRLESGEIPVASITGDTLITCEQPFATLQSGPIPENYRITWFNPRGDEIGGEPSVEATEPGNHLLRVSDPSGACSATDTFLVQAGNDLPMLTISSPEPLTCQRLEISLSAGAGTGNYQVEWSGPGIISGRNTFSPRVDRTGLYRVVVTDEDTRCTTSATVQVTADRDDPSVEVSGQTKLDCGTGEARMQASSPDPGVSYQWQTETGIITGGSNRAEVVVADTGWYELITTDMSTGCSVLDRIYIDYPEGPTDVKTRTIATCANETAGYIIVDSIFGGTPLFTYSLNNIPDDRGSYSGLAPGTYQLDLIDSRGCVFPNFLEVDSLPVPETVESVQICEGETFVWKDSVYSASGRYVDTLMAANGCDSLDVLDLEVQPAPRRDIQATLCEGEQFQIGDSVLTEAGNYMLFLPNPAGCDSLIQVELSFLPLDSLAISGPSEFCSGERVQLQAAGNFAVYEWNTGSADSTLEVDTGGIYTLTAVTADGCERTAEFELRELESPTASIFGDSLITCRDTSFSLQAGAYDPATAWSLNWQDSSRQMLGSTEVLDISDPGWYYLEVSDPSTGCTSLDSIFVEEGRVIPEISIPGTFALTCREPVINLEIAVSGSSSTELEWSGPGIVEGGQTTSPRVDQPGLYRITAVDAFSGCLASDSLRVLDDREPPILMLPDSTGLDCVTGEAFLSANAAGDSLRYQWTSFDGQIEGNGRVPEIIVNSPGLYVLEATDQTNGCASLDSVRVYIMTGPERVLVEVKPSCLDAEDGRLSIAAIEGGTAPYLFSLNEGAFSNNSDFQNLSEGNYNLAVEDAQGCLWDTTITVSTAPVFDLDLGADQRIFLGDSIRLEPLLGLPAENIAGLSWSPSAGLSCTDCLNPSAAPTTSTAYRLELTDQYGCTSEASLRITVDSRVPIYIPDAFSPNGDGINDYFTVFTYTNIQRVKEMLIFNRWGETVFQMEDFIPNDPTTGWDGKARGQALNNGVYVYYILIEFLDGEEVIFKGDVTLMR